VGTIIDVARVTDGWVRVKWPHGPSNVYRCGGRENKFDLEFGPVASAAAPAAAPAQVVQAVPIGTVITPALLKVGLLVQRSPTFRWGSQDVGKIGVVYRFPAGGGWTSVMWSGGNNPTNNYHTTASAQDLAAAQVLPVTAANFRAGAKVLRGPAWPGADDALGSANPRNAIGTLDRIDQNRSFCWVNFGGSPAVRCRLDHPDLMFFDPR
jgi:hypothetical protein